MSDTRLIRLVTARGDGIPQQMKTFRAITVSGGSNGKVYRVALPGPLQQQPQVLAKSSPKNIVDSNDEDRDPEEAPLSKNALLARENRLKKKRYINGLEQSLATAKKENEALGVQLKEKDQTIASLRQEIVYFKSVLANVREISSLIKTIKGDSPSCGMPISTSLDYAPAAKKIKLERLSESSGDLSSIHEDDDDNWMPQSPNPATPLDSDSLDVLSNFNEEDINLFGDTLPPSDELANVPQAAGVCLHVFNKKLSLEFCPTCANRALEKWAEA